MPEKRPNVLLILIDDMGWRDLSCQGSEFYETPNIDRIAREGLSFTNAYAACPVCSPTRASLLTGKYPARLGLTNYLCGKTAGRLLQAPYIDHLPTEEFGLARALGETGYQTWHVGKWHLGKEPYYPDRQGFDVNIGGGHKGNPYDGYFSPWNLDALDETNVPEGTYLTDHLTDRAIELLETRDAGRPFFLNLWYYSVHVPIEAKAEKIAKYRQKAHEMGLDTLRTFEEGEFHPTLKKKHERVVRRLVQSDPAYAAMIESLDENVGRMLDALEAAGELDNTLVIFTSDNGGLATAEGSPTCNAPLAEGKGWMYEGGTREPMLVRYPPACAAGATCDEPVTSPDVYPTILELAGLPARPDQHVDGVSFARALRGEAFDRGPIFWHFPHYGNQGGTPGSSIRRGDWKLIEFYEDGRLELYNLAEDISEDHDLSAEHPAKAAELHRRLVEWRGEVAAREPTPNPDFAP
jgi:arylsulfatase A-like enzyme